MSMLGLARGWFGVAGLVFLAVAAVAQPAPPQQVTTDPLVPTAAATHFATLTGQGEIPPVNTPATGYAWIRFDPQTNMLTWTVEYSGLSGPATGVHFHGPGVRGMIAAVALSLGSTAVLTSPLQGSVVLNAGQAAQFSAGRWYLNIHTAAHPDGEIRGQAVALPN